MSEKSLPASIETMRDTLAMARALVAIGEPLDHERRQHARRDA